MGFAGTMTWNGLGGMQAAMTAAVTPRVPARNVSRQTRQSVSLTTRPLSAGGLDTGSQTNEATDPRVRHQDAVRGSRTEPRVTPGHAAKPQEERLLDADWSVIVTRCMHGDSGAWAELVKAHHRRVYSICYRFTGSPTDSEDLTQDVFLKVYGNLTNFDVSRGSFQAWLTTLTRNLLVDHFRRSRQQRVTDSIDAGWEDSEEQSMAERLTDTQRSPHEQAAAKEIERMVQEALTRVSPELREAVILRDLQDMDYKEIAMVLKIPEGTVKSRISRGRAELARLLERNRRQVV
jgi:RNA polymerase sigma-70 factor (ECF subfamily)